MSTKVEEAIAEQFGRPIAANDGMARSLVKAGFETKLDDRGVEMLCGPDAGSGQTVALYPLSVLEGPLPANQEERKTVLRLRMAATPEYRAAWFKRVGLTLKMRNGDLAEAMLDPNEQKALAEGLDTAGGSLVPPDWQSVLLGRMSESAWAMRRCTVRPCLTDSLPIPRLQPNVANPSVYSSAFLVDMMGETPTQSDVDAVFGQAVIGVRKFRLRTAASNDWLSDAPWAMAELAFYAGKDAATKLDQQVVGGLGNGLEFGGILTNLDALTTKTDVAGTTAHTISNTTVSPGSAPKIRAYRRSLPPQYWANSAFVLSGSVYGALEDLVDAQSRAVLQFDRAADGGMLFERYPVELTSAMPLATAGANAIVLLYGDWKQAYTIAQRADISMRLVTERRADVDQTEVVIFMRAGGAVTNVDALRAAYLS